MSDVTLSYKGSDILELSDSGSATLKTGGTYCEADIEVEYVKPSGGMTLGIQYDAVQSTGNHLPTEITFVGDEIVGGFGRWGFNLPINKVNAPDAIRLNGQAMRLFKGSNMQDLILPKVEYIVGGDTIYDCNFPRIFMPMLNTNSENATITGQIYDTVLTYIEIGSLGHPVIKNFGGNFFKGNSQAFDVVIYTDKTTLAEAQALFTTAPWNGTNATITYKNSTTGEVLT